MRTQRPHRALQHIMREIDSALEGMSVREQCWLVAELYSFCLAKLGEFDDDLRMQNALESMGEWGRRFLPNDLRKP